MSHLLKMSLRQVLPLIPHFSLFFGMRTTRRINHIINGTIRIIIDGPSSLLLLRLGKKTFGHLHIVFRDWQAVNSDANSVHEHLFGLEK